MLEPTWVNQRWLKKHCGLKEASCHVMMCFVQTLAYRQRWSILWDSHAQDSSSCNSSFTLMLEEQGTKRCSIRVRLGAIHTMQADVQYGLIDLCLLR